VHLFITTQMLAFLFILSVRDLGPLFFSFDVGYALEVGYLDSIYHEVGACPNRGRMNYSTAVVGTLESRSNLTSFVLVNNILDVRTVFRSATRRISRTVSQTH